MTKIFKLISFLKCWKITSDSQKVKKLVSLENTQSLIKFVVKSSEDSCKNNKSSDHLTKDSIVIGRLPVPRNYTWFDLDKITSQVFNVCCTSTYIWKCLCFERLFDKEVLWSKMNNFLVMVKFLIMNTFTQYFYVFFNFVVGLM